MNHEHEKNMFSEEGEIVAVGLTSDVTKILWLKRSGKKGSVDGAPRRGRNAVLDLIMNKIY